MFRALSQLHLVGAAVYAACAVVMVMPKACPKLSGCVGTASFGGGGINGTKANVVVVFGQGEKEGIGGYDGELCVVVECSGSAACCRDCRIHPGGVYNETTTTKTPAAAAAAAGVSVRMRFRLGELLLWSWISTAIHLTVYAALLCARGYANRSKERREREAVEDITNEFDYDDREDEETLFDAGLYRKKTTTTTEDKEPLFDGDYDEEAATATRILREEDGRLLKKIRVSGVGGSSSSMSSSIGKHALGLVSLLSAVNLCAVCAVTIVYAVENFDTLCSAVILIVVTQVAVYSGVIIDFIGISLPPLRRKDAKRIRFLRGVSNAFNSLLILWWVFAGVYTEGLATGRWR